MGRNEDILLLLRCNTFYEFKGKFYTMYSIYTFIHFFLEIDFFLQILIMYNAQYPIFCRIVGFRKSRQTIEMVYFISSKLLLFLYFREMLDYLKYGCLINSCLLYLKFAYMSKRVI